MNNIMNITLMETSTNPSSKIFLAILGGKVAARLNWPADVSKGSRGVSLWVRSGC